MKDLIIVGAGGMSRKVYVTLQKINKMKKRWNIIGCIDDNPNALDGIKTDMRLIGSITDWVPQKNEVFVMGISDPKLKYIVSKRITDKKGVFETIVSPDVILGEYVEIGEGSVILTPYNVESCVRIGKFVTILGSTIALDGVIGDYSTTAGFANLTTAKIGKGVYVASHAILLEHVSIGDGSYVGVGSVVMKDVKAYSKVFGSPARVIEEMEVFTYD